MVIWLEWAMAVWLLANGLGWLDVDKISFFQIAGAVGLAVVAQITLLKLRRREHELADAVKAFEARMRTALD